MVSRSWAPVPSRRPPPDRWAPLAADDRGHGAPVVLLHGQPGGRRDWDDVVSHLDGRLRALVVDRPGYGRTGGPAVGLAANADAVRDLLDRHHLDRAIVVGHSWGGAVALAAAQRWPDRVSGLVLVASVGGAESTDRLDALLSAPLIGPVLALGGLVALRARRIRRLLGPVPAPAGAGGTSDDLVSVWRSFVIEQRALTRELPGVTAALARTSTPAVLVVGAGDRVVRPRSQYALAAGMPDARVIRADGRGHLLPWEAPDVVADAIVGLAAGMT